MRKIFVFVTLVLMLSSCNDDILLEDADNSVTPKQEAESRLGFSNSEEMFNTIFSLREKDLLSQKEWSSQKLKNSYFKSIGTTDSTLAYMPTEFKAVLNSDLEFIIGDSLLWYNDGKVLLLSDNKNISKTEISSLKKNKKDLFVCWENKLVFKDKKSNNTRLINPNHTAKDGENKTKYIFSAGSVSYTPTTRERSLLRANNPTLSTTGTSIQVKVEYVLSVKHEFMTNPYIYIDKDGQTQELHYSYLSHKNGNGVFVGEFIIRLYDVVQGRTIEINDPVLEGEFMGNVYYSYTVYRNHPMLAPIPGGYKEDKMAIDFFKIFSIGNTYTVFREDFNFRKDLMENVHIAVSGANIQFKIGTGVGVSTFTVTNLNL